MSDAAKTAMKERMEEIKKQQKCPVCGAKAERTQTMSRYTNELSSFLREVNKEQFQDSCLLCVSKHLGKALVLYDKMNETEDSLEKGKHRLYIIGNLCEAADESSAYPELSSEIKSFERDFRYNSEFKDLTPIIDKVTVLLAQEAPKESEIQENI